VCDNHLCTFHLGTSAVEEASWGRWSWRRISTLCSH